MVKGPRIDTPSVLEPLPPAKGVVGHVQHVVGLVMGLVQLQQVPRLVELGGEADGIAQLEGPTNLVVDLGGWSLRSHRRVGRRSGRRHMSSGHSAGGSRRRCGPWTQHIVNRVKPPSISGRENSRENQSLAKRGHRLSIVVRGGQEHFLVTGYVGHSRSSSDSGRKYRKANWQSRGPRVRVPSPPLKVQLRGYMSRDP